AEERVGKLTAHQTKLDEVAAVLARAGKMKENGILDKRQQLKAEKEKRDQAETQRDGAQSKIAQILARNNLEKHYSRKEKAALGQSNDRLKGLNAELARCRKEVQYLSDKLAVAAPEEKEALEKKLRGARANANKAEKLQQDESKTFDDALAAARAHAEQKLGKEDRQAIAAGRQQDEYAPQEL